MILHGFCMEKLKKHNMEFKNDDFFRKMCYITKIGFKIEFLTKLLDDSAWFLLEKLKKHIILTKNPNMLTKNLNIGIKIKKILKKHWKIHKHTGFPRDPCGDPFLLSLCPGLARPRCGLTFTLVAIQVTAAPQAELEPQYPNSVERVRDLGAALCNNLMAPPPRMSLHQEDQKGPEELHRATGVPRKP